MSEIHISSSEFLEQIEIDTKIEAIKKALGNSSLDFLAFLSHSNMALLKSGQQNSPERKRAEQWLQRQWLEIQDNSELPTNNLDHEFIFQVEETLKRLDRLAMYSLPNGLYAYNLYEVLAVSRDASNVELKKAYHFFTNFLYRIARAYNSHNGDILEIERAKADYWLTKIHRLHPFISSPVNRERYNRWMKPESVSEQISLMPPDITDLQPFFEDKDTVQDWSKLLIETKSSKEVLYVLGKILREKKTKVLSTVDLYQLRETIIKARQLALSGCYMLELEIAVDSLPQDYGIQAKVTSELN